MSSINEKVMGVLLNSPGHGILPSFEHQLVVCCLVVSRSITHRAEYNSLPVVKLGRAYIEPFTYIQF